jgi:polyisoprenoid-binding protein YceI
MRNPSLKRATAILSTIMVLCGASAAWAGPIEFNKFDKNHSTVGFRVPILGGLSEVEGKFMAFDAQLQYDSSDVSQCFVGATIDASSINTGIAERDTHLKSPDFFDVAKFPKIMFLGKKVEKSGKGLVVHGTLSMHGVSKEIDLATDVKGLRRDSASGDYLIGLSAKVALNRQDFGISWHHTDPLFVGDSVFVEINLISKPTPLRKAD